MSQDELFQEQIESDGTDIQLLLEEMLK